MKPLIPTINGQGQTTFLNDPQVAQSTSKILDAAADQVRAKTATNVIREVLGGGTTQSTDLEGLGSLIGGVGKAFSDTNALVLTVAQSLLNQKKENGSTQGGMDDILRLVLIMKMLKEDEPKSDSAQWIAYFQAMREQDQKWRQELMDLVIRHKDEKIEELRDRTRPDPITDQIYNQVLPTIVNQAIGQAKKDPLDQLAELKDKLDKLGHLNPLVSNGNEYTPERLKYEALQLEKAKMFSDERKHMSKIEADHKKWKEIGNMLGQVFGGNDGGPGISFAGMMQGLAGMGGQPQGQEAAQ